MFFKFINLKKRYVSTYLDRDEIILSPSILSPTFFFLKGAASIFFHREFFLLSLDNKKLYYCDVTMTLKLCQVQCAIFGGGGTPIWTPSVWPSANVMERGHALDAHLHTPFRGAAGARPKSM